MKVLLIFLLIVCVCTLDNDRNQDQCEDLCLLDVNESDIATFLTSTTEEKKQIATLFDQSFHQHGIIRLINTDIPSEIIDKTKEFFALNEETKLKYYRNGSYYETPGYKPPGLESVSNYKGDSCL